MIMFSWNRDKEKDCNGNQSKWFTMRQNNINIILVYI